ncbi:IQ domain-containing protein H-like [Sphaerodactylus townsendi]|uniref:IQ domain-containing protein H-like n=1 Tax=Sphaerodactylus townsendi TaxID=933632 RepID=UPI002026EAC3|nr:IQ domain-containing protein H-like [Sphaerodactylus townsendi]XP_048338156.1 IQ domain-containing protein H-like [Sphaerodactylus townsendi]XP_048338157.1 IQ domain-containing protein H-like [Sphaerodactylus townsendi]XP_048338158.1 IQ domain-containing protein H-like [Sphaerodactylus townsendi]
MLKILRDPQNVQYRKILSQTYGVNMPLVSRRKMAPVPSQKVARGVTMSNLSVAPPSFHLGSSCSVLPLTRRDAQKGILSLIERGLIPRAAKITLEKPLVLPKPAPLHDPHTKHKKPAADGSAESKKPGPHTYPSLSHTSKGSKGTKGSVAPPPSCTSMMSLKKHQLIPAIQKRGAALHPLCLTKNLPEEFDFLIHKGNIDYKAPDLIAFKQHCCLFWGSALAFLEHVASRLKDYAVTLAIIRGKKVLELLLDFEFRQRLTQEELLSVIRNSIAVQKLFNRPGQRYKGQNGVKAAAAKIQATWRCYKLRKAYVAFWKRQWASGVIAISWLVHVQRNRVRKTLWESRQKHRENFCIRAKHLAANWNRIRASKRTVIHIPSLDD